MAGATASIVCCSRLVMRCTAQNGAHTYVGSASVLGVIVAADAVTVRKEPFSPPCTARSRLHPARVHMQGYRFICARGA